MWAFLDESGDGGLRIGQGSSSRFIVGLVTFDDAGTLQKCDDRISRLRAELGLPAGFEFHFRQDSHRVRIAFLRALSGYPWSYHVFAVEKDAVLLGDYGFNEKEALYKLACLRLLENAKPYLLDATITIESNGERGFRRELETYLRKANPAGRRTGEPAEAQNAGQLGKQLTPAGRLRSRRSQPDTKGRRTT